MIDQVILTQVQYVLTGSGQIESWLFLNKNKSVFVWFVTKQREIAENYLPKFILTA